MEFDFRKLRGRIVEKFGNLTNFAEKMGKSKGWLHNRLTGLAQFSSEEIVRACAPDMLDIPAEDIPTYFFTPKVPLSEL